MDNNHVVETTDKQPIVEQKDKKFVQLIAIGLTIIFAVSLFYFLRDILPSQNTPKDNQTISIFPSSTPPAQFTCPKSEYVDCMPGPGPAKPQCTPEYLQWAQENCPSFKGGAY